MFEWILDILACPVCNNSLETKILKENDEEIIYGTLKCDLCNAKYPITDGIFNLLPPKRHLKNHLAKYRRLLRFYDRFSETYDEQYLNNPFFEYQRSVENRIINLTSPCGTVLDIGCGTGKQTLLLALKGCKVVGLDISKRMLKRVREKAKEQKLMDKIALVKATADFLPFKKLVFDRVYSIYAALNHVPKYKTAFKKIGQVLKNNGKIAITVINKQRILWWIYSLTNLKLNFLRKALRQNDGYLRIRLAKTGKLHDIWTHFYNPKKLKKILEEEKFQNIVLGGFFTFLRPKYDGKHEKFTRMEELLIYLDRKFRWKKPFNTLGYYLAIIAKK